MDRADGALHHADGEEGADSIATLAEQAASVAHY
jgi:hypothetical protein